mmetsp:Transcript_3442/g.5367  ORF Transcript_3442/g.5367 Transcript_3442/m.5367 type:complete len:332 (-) Transcript_3442:147-1142(-)
MSVLGFELEWLDEVSGLLTTLYMKYFIDDNTIELLKENSTFLKRIYYPDVKLSDLFLGNTITVFNRLLVVKKFANKATTEFMNAREVRYLCKVGKENLIEFGRLLIVAKKCGLVVGKVVTTSSAFYSDILSAAPGDVVLELVGILSEGRDSFTKAVNVPEMGSVVVVQATATNIDAAFKSCGKASFKSQNCTLCLIKPHVVKAEKTGEVMSAIAESGFQISAVFSVHLTLSMAEEMFEVYRGVFMDYTKTLEHMCITPVLAVMITAPHGDIVGEFRDFVGPLNPALARVLRPKSLRAIYGEDLVHNAVHCTDLPEDGEMECRYFFETLASL